LSAKPARKGRKLWPEIESGGLGALYGLFSEEDFLLNQVVERFCASPDFAQNPSLNIEKFYASQNKPHRVLESALTMPFLGSKRLIILYEANLFKAAQLADFLDYLDDPPPYTTLVFCGSKLDMRIKFSKQLKKKGKVEVLKKMWPNELLPWLKQRAELRGKSLEHNAAQRLAELSGLGLGALDSELEKLSLFVGSEQTITLKHVRQGVGAGRLHSIFDFTDALASEDLARALTAWDQLEALGEPAVRALAMITRLIKQLVQVRGILDGGGNEGQVQSTLRTPPAATQTLLRRARREDQESLAKALELILATDKALKSSPGADRVIMERLIMRLCHSVAKAKPAPSAMRAG
jgi:DNA polymerase-3 subunit delta